MRGDYASRAHRSRHWRAVWSIPTLLDRPTPYFGRRRMNAVQRGMRRLIRFGLLCGIVATGLVVVYAAYLINRLDVSRLSLETRARSVEADIVPNLIAGSDGRYFDAALELPLSISPERIPDFVKNAFIAREDQQFRWHFGVNPVSLFRAI